jgi:hypothetical protein
MVCGNIACGLEFTRLFLLVRRPASRGLREACICVMLATIGLMDHCA